MFSSIRGEIRHPTTFAEARELARRRFRFRSLRDEGTSQRLIPTMLRIEIGEPLKGDASYG